MRFEFVWSVELFGAAHMCSKWTFVLLEWFVDEHVSLDFVLSVKCSITEGTLVWLLS